MMCRMEKSRGFVVGWIGIGLGGGGGSVGGDDAFFWGRN